MLILFVSFIQTVIFGSYMIAQGFFNVYAMCVDTLFLCFCKYASFSVLLVTVYKRQRCYDDYRWNIKKLRVSSWLYGFPLSQPFLNYNFNWFLFFHCFNSILACLSWLFISTETLLCFLFLLPGCNSVCCLQFLLILSQCLDLVSGEDLERNDGSSSRPYYMSPGLHKILRKGEESAKSCAASWALCSQVFTHFSISTVCTGVWTFESKYCRAKHENCMHPSPVRDDLDMERLAFASVLNGKGKGTITRLVSTSSFELTQILAFFSAMLLFFLFFFCILCWPLPYWEDMHQLAEWMHKLREKQYECIYPKQQDFKMYRCHLWIKAPLSKNMEDIVPLQFVCTFTNAKRIM